MIIHSCYYMKKPSSSPCTSSSNHVLPKGCLFSRILRRILCFSALPWHPFDHHHQQQQKRPLLIKECQELVKKDCNLVKETEASDPIVAPGLVARLMGLESLPNDSKNSAPSQLRKGRKAITMYQELEEDDEFYTLRFGDKSCRKKRRRRRRRRVGENKENEGVTAIRGSKGDSRVALGVLMNHKNGCEKDEVVVNQRSEVVNCSENSSPDSVLEFPPDHTAATCKGDNRRVGNSKMRRTLSDELESCRNPDDDDEKKKKKKKKKKIDVQISENSLIRRTGKLATAGMEMEMGRRRRRWEEEEDKISVKEVGRDVASYILDHLLNELLITLD